MTKLHDADGEPISDIPQDEADAISRELRRLADRLLGHSTIDRAELSDVLRRVVMPALHGLRHQSTLKHQSGSED